MSIHLFMVNKHILNATENIPTDMKYLRDEGRVPEAPFVFQLSGKSNREIVQQNGSSPGRLQKMAKRPVQVRVKSVKKTPFNPLNDHHIVVNAIVYDFCWKSITKYISETGPFSPNPVFRPTLMARHVERKLDWAKKQVE